MLVTGYHYCHITLTSSEEENPLPVPCFYSLVPLRRQGGFGSSPKLETGDLALPPPQCRTWTLENSTDFEMTWAGGLASVAAVTAGAEARTHIWSGCGMLLPVSFATPVWNEQDKIRSMSVFLYWYFHSSSSRVMVQPPSLWIPPACLNMSTQLLDEGRQCLCRACSEAYQVLPCSPLVTFLVGENILVLEMLGPFLSLW